MHNIDKIIHYIKLFAKEPIEIDGRIEARTRRGFRIGKRFFHSDGCIQCGRCCLGEDHVYTEHEYKRIMNCSDEEFEKENLPVFRLHELQESIEPETHTINGKEVTVYVHRCPKTEMYIPAKGCVRETCNWMFEQDGLFRCGIHPVVSMTCDIPHLRIFHSDARKSIVSISTAQYGRNWAIECPIKFMPPKDEEEFESIKKRKIEKLRSIAACALDLNVLDTYIPEVIEYIESILYENYQESLKKDFILIHDDRVDIQKEFVPSKKPIKWNLASF